MDILLAVLTLVLSPHFVGEEVIKYVAFKDLPKICVDIYDDHLRQERMATGTEVIRIDFDLDGKDELLVCDGQCGSGGEGWGIFSRDKSGKWYQADRVFGVLSIVKHPKHNGLLVCFPCGWDEATWDYYELRQGKMKLMWKIEVKYCEPIRQKPKEIAINKVF